MRVVAVHPAVEGHRKSLVCHILKHILQVSVAVVGQSLTQVLLLRSLIQQSLKSPRRVSPSLVNQASSVKSSGILVLCFMVVHFGLVFGFNSVFGVHFGSVPAWWLCGYKDPEGRFRDFL